MSMGGREGERTKLFSSAPKPRSLGASGAEAMSIEASSLGLAHHARSFPDKPALIMGDSVLSYKCPSRIEFVAELPREPQGKVKKHELAERYGQKVERAGEK